MERTNLEQKIIKKIKENKNKNITIAEIYEATEVPYTPQLQLEIKDIINKLVKNQILEPLKTSPKDIRGNYIKYRILSKQEDLQSIKEEIIKTLAKPINIQYYLKHPKEYQENKDIISKINDYIKQQNKSELITANEKFPLY